MWVILLPLLVQCYFSNQIYCNRWLTFPLARRSLVSLVLAKKESINDIFEQLRWIINGFRVTSEYMGICKRTHQFILMEQLALYRACRVQGVRQGFKLLFFFLIMFTVEMEGTCHVLAAPRILPQWVAILLFLYTCQRLNNKT